MRTAPAYSPELRTPQLPMQPFIRNTTAPRKIINGEMD